MEIVKLNKWLKNYADEQGFPYLDYHYYLSDSYGMLKEQYTSDCLYVNSEAYKIMLPMAEEAIDNLLNPNSHKNPIFGKKFKVWHLLIILVAGSLLLWGAIIKIKDNLKKNNQYKVVEMQGIEHCAV